MRISYLALSKIPSKEANSVHVMKMCQALAHNSESVKLIVPIHENSNVTPFEYYGVKSNFEIVRIKLLNRTRIGLFIYSCKVLKELWKDKEQYIYGRDLISCFLSSLFGFKTIWESHGPVAMSRIFKIMISRNSYLKTVVISSTLRNYYINTYKINPENVVVLPDCSDKIDLTQIVPKDLKRDRFKPKVGYIGQLYPGKGMEIISQLVPLCPEIDFHIVGGNENDVDYWKNELSSFNNLVFHGYVTPSETPSYGLAMDILIAPYLKKVQASGAKNFNNDIGMWMSPLKLFEYMSYRKPIISSDLPVLHDVLNNNNSVMCNPDDIDSWVKAIQKLISNPEEANRIAENAYNDFLINYTWKTRAEKICKMYKY